MTARTHDLTHLDPGDLTVLQVYSNNGHPRVSVALGVAQIDTLGLRVGDVVLFRQPSRDANTRYRVVMVQPPAEGQTHRLVTASYMALPGDRPFGTAPPTLWERLCGLVGLD